MTSYMSRISRIIQFEIPNIVSIAYTCSNQFQTTFTALRILGCFHHFFCKNTCFQSNFQPVLRHFHETNALDGKPRPKWKSFYCLKRYFPCFYARETFLPFNRVIKIYPVIMTSQNTKNSAICLLIYKNLSPNSDSAFIFA